MRFLVSILFMLAAGCNTSHHLRRGSEPLAQRLASQGFLANHSHFDKNPVVKGALNHSEAYFLIDTGAAVNVIPEDLAAKRKYPPTDHDGIPLVSALGVSQHPSKIYNVDQLEVGKYAVANVHFRGVTRPKWETEMHNGINVLGGDFLYAANAVIDCGRNAIYLSDKPATDVDALLLADGYHRLSIIMSPGALPGCKLIVNGAPMYAELDTGASTTLVDQRWLTLNKQVSHDDLSELPFASGGVIFDGFGNPAAIKSHVVNHVEVGGQAITNLEVSISNPPAWASGAAPRLTPWLIGYDFLRKYQVIFDYGNQKAYLKHPPAP